MRLDLRIVYKQGLDNLLAWRNRYSKAEYPEKVVGNILYRKFAMDAMWGTIISCFDKPKWADWTSGYNQLRQTYSETATKVILPKLDGLLANRSLDVGSTGYKYFIDIIDGAKKGDYGSLEEIEFRYLYYLLTDESILIWAAFGGTGQNKIEAIGTITGLILDVGQDIKKYEVIDEILGQYGVSNYMKQYHKALPPNA